MEIARGEYIKLELNIVVLIQAMKNITIQFSRRIHQFLFFVLKSKYSFGL